MARSTSKLARCGHQYANNMQAIFYPLMGTGNYSATWNSTKLVHWPLMGRPLHFVQRGEAWVGLQPAQSPPGCTKCNNPPINSQGTNHRIAAWPVALQS